MPSLGQGAFMAIGAFTVALLTAKAGWPAFPATVVGVLAAAAGGVLAGVGVVRLRPVFIAVTTWILTWTVAIFLLAFRSVSGGAQGIVVPSALSVDAHYELALALLVAAILVAASLALDDRLADPLGDLVDERVALVGRQPVDVLAEDHRPQERLERLAGLEPGRLRLEPGADVDEAAGDQPRRRRLRASRSGRRRASRRRRSRGPP